MAKRLLKHQERQQAVSLFGKDLTRRANSCCELCSASGVKLGIFEVEPVPAEPDFEHCIFICETCQEQIEHPKRLQPNHWRCLNTPIWSEVPAVQVQAVHLLRKLSAKHDWAEAMEEHLYLNEEVQAWLDKIQA